MLSTRTLERGVAKSEMIEVFMGLMICMHSHYNDIGMIANENVLYHYISNVEKVKFVHCEVISFFSPLQ